MSSAPAKLAGLTGRKGELVAGADADFVVFNPDTEWTVANEQLHFRHKLSPYLGARLRGQVVETWLRGSAVCSANGFSQVARGMEIVRHG
jgi:allantoinase